MPPQTNEGNPLNKQPCNFECDANSKHFFASPAESIRSCRFPLTSSLFEGSNGKIQDFAVTLGSLVTRSDALVSKTEAIDNHYSPVTDACLVSLRSRMPLVLHQARLFVASLYHCDDDSTKTIYRLRSAIALRRAEQYLDMIESAVENPPRDALDKQLHRILNSDRLQTLHREMATEFSFRISPWVSSFLAFDLPAGPTALAKVEKPFPLAVKVEPMFEFNSRELLSGRTETIKVQACNVAIETCKHRAREFSARAGAVGDCILQVRLIPTDVAEIEAGLRVWGHEADVPNLCIREVRA